MPMTFSGRFLPATMLILLGLGIFLYQNATKTTQSAKELISKEGTLINYSFKKDAEGKLTYGIWLREFSERLVLPNYTMATFDTAAFKTTVPPGSRVAVEYNDKENTMATKGERKLYALSVPALQKTYFRGEETIEKDEKKWLDWLKYGLIVVGALLFIYKLVEYRRQEKAYAQEEM